MERVGEVARRRAERSCGSALKVAVAVGPARRFVVGDPEIQLIDVLAGRLVDELAAAEHLAEQGEVVLEQSALEFARRPRRDLRASPRRRERPDRRSAHAAHRAGRRCAVGGARPAAAGGARTALAAPAPCTSGCAPAAASSSPSSGRRSPCSSASPASTTTPTTTRSRSSTTSSGARSASSTTAAATCSSSRSATRARTCTRSSGRRTPTRTTRRARPPRRSRSSSSTARPARASSRSESRTAALRSGTYGHDMRRTFVCLGDAVNLAARLMSQAPTGQVYVTEAVQDQAGDAFAWERLPDMTVKGKDEPVSVFALGPGSRPGDAAPRRYELPIVGRAAELDGPRRGPRRRARRPRSRRRDLGRGGRRQVAAGRRVRATCPATRRPRRLRRVSGVRDEHELPGLERDLATPPAASTTRSTSDEQATTLERELERDRPALVPRAPLLDALLGIAIPDNELTGGLDAELRKTSLEALLADCLRGRASESRSSSSSRTATGSTRSRATCSRSSPAARRALPVLLVLAYRPSSEVGWRARRSSICRTSRSSSCRELESLEAEQLIRCGSSPCSVTTRAAARARRARRPTRSQGNPFYIEELLNYIRGKGVDLTDERSLARLELPESLHSLDPQSRRHAHRGAAPHPQGRERHRPHVLRSSAAGRVPGARVARRRARSPRHAADARPRPARPRGRRGVHLQARRHAGGDVREHAVRAPVAAPRAAGRVPRDVGAGRDRPQPRPPGAPLLAQPQRRQEARVPRRARARRRRRSYANEAAIDYFERAAPLLDGHGALAA